MRLGGSAPLRPSSSLTAATITFHAPCAAQRFVTLGCCLPIHLLSDCPFSSRGRGFFDDRSLPGDESFHPGQGQVVCLRYTGLSMSGVAWLQHSEFNYACVLFQSALPPKCVYPMRRSGSAQPGTCMLKSELIERIAAENPSSCRRGPDQA